MDSWNCIEMVVEAALLPANWKNPEDCHVHCGIDRLTGGSRVHQDPVHNSGQKGFVVQKVKAYVAF